MSKKLLIDYIPLKLTPQLIIESIEKNGTLVVEGIIQRADARNHNGRVYPKQVLAEKVNEYIKGPVAESRAFGELDHSDTPVINLKNVCINIKKLWWDDDNLMGRIQVLTTPSGNIVTELFKNGCSIGISSRALGSVRQLDENTVEVQDDLEIICWDIVSTPSTHGAFITPINEGKTHLPQEKYQNVNNILRDIICLNTNSCSL